MPRGKPVNPEASKRKRMENTQMKQIIQEANAREEPDFSHIPLGSEKELLESKIAARRQQGILRIKSMVSALRHEANILEALADLDTNGLEGDRSVEDRLVEAGTRLQILLPAISPSALLFRAIEINECLLRMEEENGAA